MKRYKLTATSIKSNQPLFLTFVDAKDVYDAMKQGYLMYGRSFTWVLGAVVA